jgi:hypothetical protein
MIKDIIIRVRAQKSLELKLKKKAKKYKVSYADLIRKKLNDDNDKHLFI